MLIFAVEGATHGCEGFGEWKDIPADQQVIILGSDRMPEHAFRRNRHLRKQICPCQSNALDCRASQGNSPDHPVLLTKVMGVKEAAELLGLRISRHCRRQSHPESFGTGQLDPLPGACPCPLSTMAVVALRCRTVEADLQGHAFALQRAQRFEPTSGKQHAVGEDRGRCRYSARGKDLADIWQHEWLAAGDKDFTYAEFRRLDRDPSHPLDAESPPRRFGLRAHATIITAQVAVEVCVKPQTRADGPIFSDILTSLSIAEHPTGATFFDCHVDEAVAGEATPCLELGADTWIAADHGHEVALTAAAQRSYQIRQEARGKCLGAGVE